METYVWYGAYGSNLYPPRFYLYVQGGLFTMGGKKRKYIGCHEKSLPVEEAIYCSNHNLYFSQKSSTWENSGVAFLTSKPYHGSKTWLRLYRITLSQFKDVFQQENGITEPVLTVPDFSINTLKEHDFTWGSQNTYKWYGRIIYLGHYNGYPILSFTAKWEDDEYQPRAPGEKYLYVIMKGLARKFNLSPDQIAYYLHVKHGILDFYSLSDLKILAQRAVNE